MYILLTLFFVSLLGIIFMIGRKHLLIESGYAFTEKPFLPDAEYFEDLKMKSVKNIRKFGFILLVLTIRLYVKVSSFTKSQFKEALQKIKDMRTKKSGGITIKIKQENKFLKMVGQYKRKIRKIKEKVEEENL